MENSRRRARRLEGSLLAALAAFGIYTPSHAQDALATAPAPSQRPAAAPATEDAVTSPTDIVVTANKRAETLMSVPVSVTAVAGEQLVNKGIYNVQDLVKVTPGLSYVESGRSVPVFSLRGVGFFDQSVASRPTVSVYVDEAPIPFSIEAKGAAFDLERVEVLKGPQGTLFGQNATGGAINYIAAKPTSTFHAGATGSFGRFDAGDVQAYASGPLSSNLNGRIAVRTAQGGAWQKSYTRDDTLGTQRFTQARAILDWRPTDRLKVELNGSGWIDKSDTQAPQYIAYVPGAPALSGRVPLMASYPKAPANGRAADWDPGKRYRNDSWFYQVNLRADYEALDALAITSITSYSKARIRQLVDADGTALTNLDAEAPGDMRTLSEELRGSGDIGHLSYIVGLNYESDVVRQAQTINIPYSTVALSVNPATPLDRLTSPLHEHFENKAVFGNLDYHVTDQITLHGGIRYTDTNLDYDACSIALSPSAAAALTTLDNSVLAKIGKQPIAPLATGVCATLNPSGTTDRYYSSLDQTNVSWRAGVDFKPATGILLYANVSKGYKSGSAATPAATNDLQFSPAVQESVLAYEAGFKGSLFDRKVELTAAAFYYDYRNKQVLGRVVFEPNVFGAQNALTNIPKSEIAGGEAQITLYPVHGLTLTAAGTYLHSKVKSDFINSDILGATTNFRGGAFPYTPKWQLVLDGDYRFPLTESVTGLFGGNANYRSKTTAGFGGNNLLDINSYWLLDLRAGIEFGDRKYRLQLYGKNVTNTYYWTNVNRSVDNVRRYAGVPATYGIQFGVRF
jgi:iron complex outermembrane receptor protein